MAIGAGITIPLFDEMFEIPPPVTQIRTESPAAEGGEGEGEEGAAPAEEGTTRIAILAGAAVQGSPDYDPDPAEVPAGNSIVWNNEDTVPHTSTSGTGPQDPASAQLFDTSIINGGEESTPVQIQGASEGQTIPYYCIVHPYMTAELTITAAGQGGGGGAAQTGETGSSNQTAGSSNQTAGSSNQTAGSSNQTAGSSNQTAETAGAATATATGGGAVTLTILEGSSIQGSPDYDPDELTVAAGSEVTVTNDDTLPHTVTSGTSPTDPNSAQSFDTSLINGGESATLSLAQVSAGQYGYYCMVHPYMTGSIVVQ